MKRATRPFRTWSLVSTVFAVTLFGCAGGSPLLYPARTLPKSEIRATTGFTAQFAATSLAGAVADAQAQARANPFVPGPQGANESYAKGALVVAAITPGITPFVAARVGVGNKFEGGLAFTGRGARIDVRRSFDVERITFSIGPGVSVLFYGNPDSARLPNLQLNTLHGYGTDLPVLVGWQSRAGMYRAWLGARGGWERVEIGRLSSGPNDPDLLLAADRFAAGGLVGLAAGLGFVHVAFELEVAHQWISGRYNGTHASLNGLSFTPSAGLWWAF